jgi:hypothetical protein
MENQILIELRGEIIFSLMVAELQPISIYRKSRTGRHSGANDLFPRSIPPANRTAAARNVAPTKMLMELPMIEYVD